MLATPTSPLVGPGDYTSQVVPVAVVPTAKHVVVDGHTILYRFLVVLEVCAAQVVPMFEVCSIAPVESAL